jgi:resuscitation-promoting factor RpfB
VKTEEIPFEKQVTESNSLAKGKTQLQTAGVNGVKTITYTITLSDGVETNRTSKEEITTPTVTEVTVNGTYIAPPASQCDSNYSGCVPVVSYDLDCADIGFQVRVLGTDRHRFDGDHDGWGCESY